MDSINLINISKVFTQKELFKSPQSLWALKNISLSFHTGQTLGIVGESGCGKSTLAKILMSLEHASQGKYFLYEKEIKSYSAKELARLIQMVFQNPLSSLNPSKKSFQIVEDPLIVNTKLSSVERKKLTEEILEKVNFPKNHYNYYPHMLSGGLRQRLGIARALVLRPKILICDEATSALDISVQAQVLGLLKDLKKELNLSIIFISHDLHVINYLSDEVIVMYLGQIMERGATHDIFQTPQHPYTKALLNSSVQVYTEERCRFDSIKGELPSPINPPQGCPFSTRCPYVEEECHKKNPGPRRVKNRLVACHLIN